MWIRRLAALDYDEAAANRLEAEVEQESAAVSKCKEQVDELSSGLASETETLLTYLSSKSQRLNSTFLSGKIGEHHPKVSHVNCKKDGALLINNEFLLLQKTQQQYFCYCKSDLTVLDSPAII